MCEMAITRDALSKLNENDLDALRAWAELLSTNANSETALRACQMLCKYILRYYPEDYEATSTLLGSLHREKGVGKSKEVAKTMETMKHLTKYWLSEDPGNYAYLQLAKGIWEVEDYMDAISSNPEIAIYHVELAKVLNEQGNEHFVKADYKKAIEKYKEAIEHNPNDAVIQSNLALGWEQLREPGKRLAETESAILPLRAALKLDPKNNDYADRLKKLEQRETLLVQFGEPTRNLVQAERPIGVEMSPELVPYILSARTYDLSPEFSALINDMKGRIQESFGLMIPGIKFRAIEDPTIKQGTYIIQLAEDQVASGNIALDKRFFAGTTEALAALQIAGEEADVSVTGFAGYWIGQADWAKAEQGGAHLWGVGEYLLRQLELLLEKNLVEFIDF